MFGKYSHSQQVPTKAYCGCTSSLLLALSATPVVVKNELAYPT
jgi:hypothetical protein